jgi:fumarate reductase flavoprotein subunit
MNMELIFSLPPPFHGKGGTPEELAAFRQPNLIVNRSGERIMNEEVLKNTTFTGNVMSIQQDSCGFIIFDGAAKRDYEQNGMHFNELIMVADIDAAIQKALDQGCNSLFVANSLEELAGKTGIDLKGLLKTIEEYNKACEKGHDDIFHKSYQYLRTIKEPKFYAGKLVASAYGSLGGIKINYKTEVLDSGYQVIPGFYAAGVDANTIYGDSYVFILPGNTMGFALNSGRIAGENAAEYVKSI